MKKSIVLVLLSGLALSAVAAESVAEVKFSEFSAGGQTVKLADRTGQVNGETVRCQQIVKSVVRNEDTNTVTFEITDTVSRSSAPGVVDLQGTCPL